MTTTATPDLPRLLTPSEAREALRVSRSTLYRMVGRGELTAIRLGRPDGPIRIPFDELERLPRRTEED